MTKKEFIDEIRNETGLTEDKAAYALAIVLDALEKALSHGEDIRLRDFGRFHLVMNNPKTIYNPKNQQRTTYEPRPRIMFTPAQALVKRVRKEAPKHNPHIKQIKMRQNKDTNDE